MPSLCSLACLLAAAAVVPIRAAPVSAAAAPLPAYALAYAPILYLASTEQWWPSDVATHLQNVVPEVASAAVAGLGAAGSVTLATLGALTPDAFLTSKDNVDSQPAWLVADYGKPGPGGYSAAPGTIVAVQKNATWVDVFYFAFYSYNHGGTVLGIEFDDHVGDWEHTMIRFVDGQPTAMYFSQHSAGSAYAWAALAKGGASGARPLGYVGRGGHAHYARAGEEDYTVALGLVHDTTDAGVAWDMAQHYRGYWFDAAAGTFAAAAAAAAAAPAGNSSGSGSGSGNGNGNVADDDGSWLQWAGRWGDAQYPSSRWGQYCLASECHYVSGPTGPVAKNLARTALCQKETDCTVYTSADELTHQVRRGVV